MEKRIMLWIAIGVLFFAVLFLTFKASTLSTSGAGETGKLDTTGWTDNELMNYQMHGIVPARAGGSTAGSSNGAGQVGGC